MLINSPPLRGLIAATFTPLKIGGAINIEAVPQIVSHLIDNGVAGLYVLGSTGEGPSLTHDERCRIALAFIDAARGKLPVIVQVGSESLRQARDLASFVQDAGAEAISAVSPIYFRPNSDEALARSMAEIAAGAPELPFYYYHIPSVTGVTVNMVDFLRIGSQLIPTLRGIKFTSPHVYEFQACLEFGDGSFDLLWGLDEMLLSALAVGAKGAVGSTYNFAAPIYRQLMSAFAYGDMEEARRHQSRSIAVVRAFSKYGSRSAQKAIMPMVGPDCGPPRLPIEPLSPMDMVALHRELEAIGFLRWMESSDLEPTAN